MSDRSSALGLSLGVVCFLFLLNTGPKCLSQPRPNSAKIALRGKGFDAAWIDQLPHQGEPRWYSDEELRFIGHPVGGQYAGQLYLGGDGRLWYWDIFNQAVIDPGGPGDKFYNTPMLPDDYRQVDSGFVLDLGDRAILLDGRGFDAVRFRGEYPIAKVELLDNDLPIAVALEAFSPFCPTNSQVSSIPATLLCYTLLNTSDEAVTLRLGGWLENAGNRQAVNAGRVSRVTLPIEGATALHLTARVKESKIALRKPITLAAFEDGYGEWKSTGKAFGNAPFNQLECASWQQIQGHQGQHLINSHNTRAVSGGSREADALTGTLTSPAFRINRKYVSFLIAGGSHDECGSSGGLTVVQVLVDDEVVATAVGDNSNQLRRVNVDLTAHQGKEARIRVVDSHTGAWGIIEADDFILTDTPRQAGDATIAADTGSMAIALLGIKGKMLDPVVLPAHWNDMLKSVQAVVTKNAGVLVTDTLELAPGKSAEVCFAICWHFPNGHLGSLFPGEITQRSEQRNYYAKFYEDAADVARDLDSRHDELVALSRLWRDTWYDSTLPVWFLDRTFQNTSTLATTSAFRMHDAKDPSLDGRVYFWEGTYLGPGTCTHVTHYEQAFGRLFPDAARAQRSLTDFGVGWNEQLGYIQYRAEWNVGQHFGIPHAIDGHGGTILRTFREHSTCADNSFLCSIWPRVKRATQFMIDQDAGRGFFVDVVPEHARNQEPDGVLEGPQYHTLDKYWNGVIPWTSGMYNASLRASAQMAKDMDDHAFASECARIADLGMKNLAERTFSKDHGYFIHHPDQDFEALINVNTGCHIDQMLGDYWTHQAGLPQVFPREHARSTLASIFKHNLYRRADDYRSEALIKVHRYYADDDEPGTFICTFPHGGAREAVPQKGTNWDGLVAGYFSECMTGFTYAAASHMIDEGLVTEGLALCRAIHDRYAEAPLRRNPFNEVEYGNHYSRAMSSYGAYVSACGFTYHGPRGKIGFAPRVSPQDFKAAFTTSSGWGSYTQRITDNQLAATMELKYGDLRIGLLSFELPNGATVLNSTVTTTNHGSHDIVFKQIGQRVDIFFPEQIDIEVNDKVAVTLVY